MFCKGASNRHRPDLTGKVAVVIGGTAGIGVETARALAKMGARVIITGRNKEKAALVIISINAENSDQGKKVVPVVFMKSDLSDLGALKTFAAELGQKVPQINLLVNNAGLISPEMKKTKEGLEMTMGSNFVGPMYLTHLLMPLLKKSQQSKIINVASMGYIWGMNLKQNDSSDFLLKNLQPEEYSSFKVYTKSKLGNVYFTSKLAELLEKSGQTDIKTISLHPGAVRTDLSRDYTGILKQIYEAMMPILWIIMKSNSEGSQTTLACCCMPFEKLFNGAFYSECKPYSMAAVGKDQDRREKVWRLAADEIKRLTGESIFSDIDK